MSNTNFLSRGLLGLFGAQTDGRAPAELGSNIQATFDLVQFISNGQRQRVFLDSVTTTAMGIYDFGIRPEAVVPQNETWLLYNYTVQCTTVLGDTPSIQPLYIAQTLGSSRRPFLLGSRVQNVVAGASQVLLAGMFSSQPVWIPPNSILGFCYSDSITNNNVFGFADYVRVRL